MSYFVTVTETSHSKFIYKDNQSLKKHKGGEIASIKGDRKKKSPLKRKL